MTRLNGREVQHTGIDDLIFAARSACLPRSCWWIGRNC